MRIAVDKGQQAGKHETKHNWLRQKGHELVELPLPVGDYVVINEKILDVLDRKSSRVMINKDKETEEYIKKIGTEPKKLDFLGTYKVTVDSKKDLQEVISNVCSRTHGRFRDEVILAHNNGIKLFILVENGGKINSLDAVKEWINPRQFLYEKKIRKEWNIPKDADFQTEVAELKKHGAKIVRGPTTGEELYKAMVTMSEKYGVEWVFTDKKSAGMKIIELLGGDAQ
jgi:ribosome-associated protein